MITVHIRKQGGAAIITIPADVLKILNIEVGAKLELDVNSAGFIARPAHKATRKRYSLAELLQGTTPASIKSLNKKNRSARDRKSIGRELT